MTREDIQEFLSVVDVCFPNWKPKNPRETINAWYLMLNEYSRQEAELALKAFVASDTSGFAPSIGQIISQINDIRQMRNGEALTEMQAWALVSKALRDSAYHAKERFNELPEIVQKAVGSPEILTAWGTDPSYNENVAQSHFISCYRNACERERKNIALPASVKMAIEVNMQKRIGENNES